MTLMMLAPSASIISIIGGSFLHYSVRCEVGESARTRAPRPPSGALFTLPALPTSGRSPLNYGSVALGLLHFCSSPPVKPNASQRGFRA